MPDLKIPKYPFERVQIAEKPTNHRWLRMLSAESCSGLAAEANAAPKKFLEMQQSTVAQEVPPFGITPPKWVLARIATHAEIEVVCDDLITRLRRVPSKKAFIETQRGFNELGRREGGGKLLRRVITQELVNEFIQKGGD